MNPLITTIPEEPADLAAWLEDVLVRGQMPQLAAELQTVHGQGADEAMTLDQALPLDAVFGRGLAVLSSEQLRGLMIQPDALLGLSERIFVEGGSYWDDRLRRVPGAPNHIRASLNRLKELFSSAEPPLPLAEEVVPREKRRKWYLAPWLVGSLTAAAVLAAVVYIPQIRQRLLPERAAPAPEVASRWGWLKIDEVPKNLPPADYLERIAAQVEEWDNGKPETPEALAQRIGELRQGCARLQLQNGLPLQPKENEWLLEKCRLWAKNIDQHLADLEKNQDVDKVRGDVSANVKKMATAIRLEAGRLRQS